MQLIQIQLSGRANTSTPGREIKNVRMKLFSLKDNKGVYSSFVKTHIWCRIFRFPFVFILSTLFKHTHTKKSTLVKYVRGTVVPKLIVMTNV